MPTEFIIPAANSADAREFAEVLALEEFVDFGAHAINIKLCLKATFKGEELQESKPAVKVIKAPPIWLAFDESISTRATLIPHYAIAVDKFAWDDEDGRGRKRLIHLGLSQLAVEVKEDGTFKVKKRQPDVVTYKTTVQRYGLEDNERDVLSSSLARGAAAVTNLVLASATGEDE